MATSNFLFPEWVNRSRPLAGVLLTGVPVYVLGLLYFAGSPTTTDVGYSPKQPLPFSHQVHAGQMGLDCRYCHTTVEVAAFAAIPHTSVCMNCHKTITRDGATGAAESKALRPLVESSESGNSVRWVRVHDLPDFVYFDHSAHVSRGVGCVSCHGRIDRMEQVYQAKKLSMAWCLECHRDPAPHIRPLDLVTNLDPVPGVDPRELGQRLMEDRGISPPTDCSTCHR